MKAALSIPEFLSHLPVHQGLPVPFLEAALSVISCSYTIW